MKFIAIQALLIVAANGINFFEVFHEEWKAFKVQHKKSYESKIEELMRMKIFVQNRKMVAKHNQRYERGDVTYTLAINKYSDMLLEEFTNAMNGYNRTVRNKMAWLSHEIRPASYIPPANIKFPQTLDWRIERAVTAVMDQGNTCKSCWAFSATGALEGQYFRKTGQLVPLSVQNLVDCIDDGCSGGLMSDAYEYISLKGGIDNANSYPYEKQSSVCRYNTKSWAANDVTYATIIEGNEDHLKSALAAEGPISIAVDSSHESFKSYKSGVYINPDCSAANINHAMLVVGYGSDEKGGDYWLVKNSWGANWGDGGYIKMARNMKNHCGIASDASYPII